MTRFIIMFRIICRREPSLLLRRGTGVSGGGRCAGGGTEEDTVTDRAGHCDEIYMEHGGII